MMYLFLLLLFYEHDVPLVDEEPSRDVQVEGGHPRSKSHAQLLALHGLTVSLPLPHQILVCGEWEQAW